MTGQRVHIPPGDMLALQRLVLDFAHRDRGRWDELQALFLPRASIEVTWYHGPIEGFVAASRHMAQTGAPASKHLIATPRIDIAGDRAVGETDVVIMIRLPVPAGELDVTSWARFHDLFLHQDGGWRIARRTAVYEKDRVDPVGTTPLGEGWSQAELAAFPAACKHLAKLLAQVGKSLMPGTIETGSAAEQAVFAQAREWLAQGVPA